MGFPSLIHVDVSAEENLEDNIVYVDSVSVPQELALHDA